uniref:Lipase domain-containing protein n=2 Tax=Clastoptera arizonana TaxID=38151 RepID=A0A1B6DU95_9HEMI
MIVITFIFAYLISGPFVYGDSGLELKIKTPIFHGPQMIYKKGANSLLMKDEQGRPFRAILKADSRFNLRSSTPKDNVTFYLYTRQYNTEVQVFTNDTEGLKYTSFNTEDPTIILVHGFINSVHSNSVQLIRQAYLSAGNFNVIGVDWSTLAQGPWYNHAAKYTYGVGLQVAEFIDFLVSRNVNLKNIHLIGHSLGAHVSGVAAKNIKSGKLSRLTGLDPALPLFDEEHMSKRIDSSDADMVDCIHTCGGYLGFYTPICSHDFYPNGGSLSQPGCFWDIFGDCSHGRSYEYYAESIFDVFLSDKCTDITEVGNGKCANGTGVMGHHSTGTPAGIYYLTTKKQYPFSADS